MLSNEEEETESGVMMVELWWSSQMSVGEERRR